MGISPVADGARVTSALLNELPSVVSQFTTGSVSNTVTETVIGSFVIPANTISAVNNGFRFNVFGTADSNGTGPPTLTTTLRLGATGTISDTSIRAFTLTERAGSSTNLGWTAEGWMLFTTVGTSGALVCSTFQNQDVTSGTAAANYQITPGGTGTFNTTVQLTLSITATWNTASTANISRTLAGVLYTI
jgi:hypothetical protein